MESLGNYLGYVRRMELSSRADVFHSLYGRAVKGSKYVQGSWGKNMDFQPFLFRSALEGVQKRQVSGRN